MKQNNYSGFGSVDYNNTSGPQEKGINNKYEYDLYDDKKNTVEKLVRVKRTQSSDKSEKWKISVDNKIVFIVDGSKLSKKEKEYLRTLEGLRYLINRAKTEIKSISQLKAEMKKILKNE